MMRIQHHGAEEMLKRGVDHFDRLYDEGAKITCVMAISAHPYISGVPHRFG
jgi:allantoinase